MNSIWRPKSYKLLFGAILLTALFPLSTQAKARWVAYKSNLLSIEVTVPDDWNATKAPKALVFHYDDLTGGTAAFGILKSEKISNIEEAADKEYQPEMRLQDWTRSAATVSGMRAIKITGTDTNDSSKRFVRYYVEASGGVYIIQCLGTADRWQLYSPTFATVLKKLKFL